MKSEILTEFCGVVNYVKFNDPALYYSAEYIVREFERKFEIEAPRRFVEDIKDVLMESEYFEENYLYYVELLEEMILYNIDKTKSILELSFEVIGDDFSDDILFIINKHAKEWEKYYGKIIPIIKEKGIPVLDTNQQV